MFNIAKSATAKKRSLVVKTLVLLMVLSTSCSRGPRKTVDDPEPRPDKGLTSGPASPTLYIGENLSSGLTATADAFEEYPTETPAQENALDEAAEILRRLAAHYLKEKPGMDLSALTRWLSARDAERVRLEAAARALRAAGLTALAAALEELAARQDVLVFAKALPIGKGWCLPLVKCKAGASRHMYLTSVGAQTAELDSYRFKGIAFQVFSKALTSRGQAITQAIYQCKMDVKEGKQWLGGILVKRKTMPLYFLNPRSDCDGQTVIGTFGYVGSAVGVATGRALYWMMRWTDSHGDDNDEYTDSLTIPNIDEANAIEADESNHYNFVSAPKQQSEATVIGYVP